MSDRQYITRKQIDGIDVYVWSAVTRPAMDEYFEVTMPIYDAHYKQYADTLPLFYVLDLSQTGMFSMRYMIAKANRAFIEYPTDPEHYIAYVIQNTQDEALVKIMNQVTARNLGHTRKAFLPSEMDDAIAWLKTTRDALLSQLEDNA